MIKVAIKTGQLRRWGETPMMSWGELAPNQGEELRGKRRDLSHACHFVLDRLKTIEEENAIDPIVEWMCPKFESVESAAICLITAVNTPMCKQHIPKCKAAYDTFESCICPMFKKQYIPMFLRMLIPVYATYANVYTADAHVYAKALSCVWM
ncbi:hypothetical protein Btru_021479 [Bulinus truncatus]|nr:hypothetical protein Btru_021479 [Bulinus truncatus]